MLRILLCFAAIFYMYILKTISKFKFALLCLHLQHDNVLHQLEAGTGCVYFIDRSRAEGIHQPAQFLVRKSYIILICIYVTLVKSRCYICYICHFGVTKAEPAEDDTVLQGFRISLVLRPLPNHDLGQSRFRFESKKISNNHEITRSARSFVKDIYILLGETHSDPFLDTSLLSRVSVDQRLKQK